ncbi:MAG: hypothetical protein AMXMBFR64_60360 [Myxococcales bacterium]
MTRTIAVDSRDLALELHRILKELDPARWRDDLEAAVRSRISHLESRMSGLAESAAEMAHDSDLASRLRELVALLRDRVPAVDPSGTATRAHWMEYRDQLHHAYEGLSKSLDAWSVHVPSLRPTNYARNVFHVSSALIALLTIEIWRSPTLLVTVATAFAVFSWSCEISRRYSARANQFLMWVFGKVAHAHERFRVNSATWYATALLILALTVPPMVSAVAVAVLGLADPAAALVGRRWGRIRLINGRSLEGTTAFLLTGFVLSAALLLGLHPELPWRAALIVAATASALGAFAELVSRRVDDNFSIPIAAGGGGMLALVLLGQLP